MEGNNVLLQADIIKIPVTGSSVIPFQGPKYPDKKSNPDLPPLTVTITPRNLLPSCIWSNFLESGTGSSSSINLPETKGEEGETMDGEKCVYNHIIESKEPCH
jgi:hypothetical protein